MTRNRKEDKTWVERDKEFFVRGRWDTFWPLDPLGVCGLCTHCEEKHNPKYRLKQHYCNKWQLWISNVFFYVCGELELGLTKELREIYLRPNPFGNLAYKELEKVRTELQSEIHLDLNYYPKVKRLNAWQFDAIDLARCKVMKTVIHIFGREHSQQGWTFPTCLCKDLANPTTYKVPTRQVASVDIIRDGESKHLSLEKFGELVRGTLGIGDIFEGEVK